MKKLRLNKEKAKFGGVCAGLGDYFNCDPIWFRLAFIVGFFIPFPVFIAYFIMLIIID